MKKIYSLLTIIVLSASIALADGHTGSGGRCDNCPPPCTENCGGGSLAGTEPGHISETDTTLENDGSSFVEEWKEFFFDLIG